MFAFPSLKVTITFEIYVFLVAFSYQAKPADLALIVSLIRLM